jgi:hypothetical protein
MSMSMIMIMIMSIWDIFFGNIGREVCGRAVGIAATSLMGTWYVFSFFSHINSESAFQKKRALPRDRQLNYR